MYSEVVVQNQAKRVNNCLDNTEMKMVIFSYNVCWVLIQ